MLFHPGWLGPTEDLGYGGYYTRDGCYGHIGHQQDNRILRQENQMVRNPKPDGPVSQEATTTPGHRHEQEALKDGPFADQPVSSQGRTGPRSNSSADGNRVLEVKAETRTKAGTSS
jgi:hypothetical protein